MKYLYLLAFTSILSYSTAQTNTAIPVGEVNISKIEKPVRPSGQIKSSESRILKVEKHIPQPATRSIKGEEKEVQTDCSKESGVLKMECIKSAIGSGNLNKDEETKYRTNLSRLETIFEDKMSTNFKTATKQEQSYFLEYLKSNKRDSEYIEYISKLK